jgi:hypothetical protein
MYTPKRLPYLSKAEGKKLKRLMTMADEEILVDKELRAAKGTRSSSIGYWGGEGVVGFGFAFWDFLSYISP